MMNEVNLIGYVAHDLELKHFPDGTFCKFKIIVPRTKGYQHGEKCSDLIKITTMERVAEDCAAHLKKGSLVSVSGHIQSREKILTTDKEPKTVNTLEVLGTYVSFLDIKSKLNSL
jgi:single-strand DNA-binding protein